jgi:hypothetical protein
MSAALANARAAKSVRAGMYAKHVVELAEAHGLLIRERRPGGRATPSLRLIEIGPVRGPVSYYVALHEIGHCVGRGRSAPLLEGEANAWEWAIDHAMIAPTPAVRKAIVRCLRSYHARHVRMAHRRHVRFPPAHHVFWTLAHLDPPRPSPAHGGDGSAHAMTAERSPQTARSR